MHIAIALTLFFGAVTSPLVALPQKLPLDRLHGGWVHDLRTILAIAIMLWFACYWMLCHG
ncbi:MAG TPA: hypothetical protein VHU87_01950 [Rhizomicrobium sp.]|jgi:hypothetical protein|nr:hypothetical protein [Rhizomicrobium sp.]